MATNSNWLVNTLVQRGESDSYIRGRLEILGISPEEAEKLIYLSRRDTDLSQKEASQNNPILVLVLLEISLLLAAVYGFIVWFLN